MEKISINIVTSDKAADHSTRLYNIGTGFRGVFGQVFCRIADCLYLGFTAERKYVVAVEGDLVLSTETSDSFATKTDGVYGFDIDWSQTAKVNGKGVGKIVVANPDAPSEVSTFEVVIAESPAVRVVFPFNAGNYARVNLGDADISVVDPAVKALLSANDDDNVYALGVAFCEAMLPAMGDNAFRMLTDIDYVFGDRRFPSWGNCSIEEESPVKHTKYPFIIDEQPGFVDPRDPLVGTPNLSDPSTFRNEEHSILVVGDLNFSEGLVRERFCDTLELLTAVLGHELPHRGGALDEVLIGSRNMSPSGALDLLIVDGGAFAGADLSRLFGHPEGFQPSDHLPLMLTLDLGPDFHRPEDVIARDGDAAVVRAGIEELMASYDRTGYGDAAIKFQPLTRDFTQLARTRANDLERIELAVAAADALGIDTSNVASRRDAALEKLVVFSDRFETGGTHEVTMSEAVIINDVFSALWSIHADLDGYVSNWHHYKQHEATHEGWEKRLADRKRNFKLGEGHQDNRIAQNGVKHAANPEEVLASSKAAFVALFQAIQRGDLRTAANVDLSARQFSMREHQLDLLIRQGKLVAVEDNS